MIERFQPRQVQRENFLLQSELSVLTLYQCPFHPLVTAVACKRPQSFCQKCRWQVSPKHTYSLDLMKLEWAYYAARHSVGTFQEKRAHTQLIRKHSATVVSACWAIVDWSWPKKVELVCARWSPLRKMKVQVGNESSNFSPKSVQTRKKPPPSLSQGFS